MKFTAAIGLRFEGKNFGSAAYNGGLRVYSRPFRARTIATSLIHSKLDYCNFLFLNLPQSQLGRLQFILNFSARAVSKTPNFAHISSVLKWLNLFTGSKLSSASNMKFVSITYKVLQSKQPSYLHSPPNVQSYRTTRSSVIITLQRPSVRSRLKITDRSLNLPTICSCSLLWNLYPKQLRQPSAPPSHGTGPALASVSL